MYLRLKHIFTIVAALWVFSQQATFAQAGTYYDGIDTSSSTVVTDLHNLIYTHTRITYDNFDETNIANFASYDTTGGQRAVVCVYTGYIYVYTPPFTWTLFSREHTWCQSWMPTVNVSGFTSRPEYSDQFHIFPVHQNNANGRRSNHPLGKVKTVSYQFLDGKLGTDSLGHTVYEPRDAQKGDAARALFYMAVCYNGVDGYDWTFNHLNTVTLPESLSEAPEDVNLLIQWTKQDPPDSLEQARNEYVHSIQGNRNPFIDHPEYVDVIDFNTLTKKGTDTTSSGGGSTVNHLIVYEIYGGGGNTGSTYTNDYIVLYNPTSSLVSVAGWTVQYASAIGTSWSPTLLSGSIQPEGFYLVQEAVGTGGTTNLPTPDATGSIAMSATAGKVALCNSTTTLSGANPTDAQIIDMVGFGSTASGYEGSGPATSPSNTNAISRKNNGQDTDDNANDFTTSSPHPENSANALPVQLVSFAAVQHDGAVELRWTTATEVNNSGFDIERSSSYQGTPFQKIGYVPGRGTSSAPSQYLFVDRNLSAGLYSYRLKQIDRGGTFKYSNIAVVSIDQVAKVFRLNQNYPNPFNPSTTIEFSLEQDGRATLKVFSLLGQEVATLFDGQAAAGQLMKVTFDASRLSSGVYFSRLQAGGHTVIRRMMLME
jgi:endonuclease I